MSKFFHLVFVIMAIVFIVITFINMFAVIEAQINVSVDESTLPSHITDAEDLINELTLGYVWQILLWFVLGIWHFLLFLGELIDDLK